MWHVLRTAPHRERWVGRELHRGLGIDWYVPIERRKLKLRGRPIERIEPLIRGYVFARDISQGVWRDVRSIRGVIGWLERDGEPAILSDAEVRLIRDLERTHNVQVSQSREIRYRIGDRVRVTAGPFATLETLLDAVRGQRVRIASPIGPVWMPTTVIERMGDGQI